MSSNVMTLFLSISYRPHCSHIWKNFWKFWKIEKEIKILPLQHQRWKNKKSWQNIFFSNKSYSLNLNLISTCSKLSFEVHDMGFAQNLKFFISLAIDFPFMINFIPRPLAAKIIIRGELNVFDMDSWRTKNLFVIKLRCK